jgi:hypothetical protein
LGHLEEEQLITGKPLLVTQPDGLDQVLRLPMQSSVLIELPTLGAEESTRWQREINKILHTCGCSEATAALLITMGLISIYIWFNWGVVKSAPFFSFALGIAVCATSIAAGKAFGKFRARRHLVESVRLLQSILMQSAI